MKRILILVATFVLCMSPAFEAAGLTGSIELDELCFDKIVNKFEATLVKFDVAFPYGDNHEAYIALAKDAKEVDELLVAEVGVKDYGEKDNEALAKKYGATKDNFPVVKLFVKGKTEPLTFDASKGFTTEEIRRFVRENTGIYLSLPGCVRSLDQLAIKFMKSKDEQRESILKEAEQIQSSLPRKDSASGKIYKTIMEKILEKGEQFVKSEFERVKKILSGKLSEEKKREMGIRINILQTFQLHDKQIIKQEL